jgi:hypothetical protein
MEEEEAVGQDPGGEPQVPMEVEAEAQGGEAQVPIAMEVEANQVQDQGEPQLDEAEATVPAQAQPQAQFHNYLEVRNYTKYELEGSPTLWFDEFQKCYVLTKDATDARPTVYLKCHRYTVKRGN